ncbi:MAG: ATP synthase F1 subunit gamma [Candidatus Pacebacteria bacterium]|nr:ATP synthase F1 subunit gamma [Candidatus Paceibacterota bacterium]
MANTRQLKRRINTAGNISKITKAMEMVAASKMKKAQHQALAARPYAQELYQALQKVSDVIDSEIHPLLADHGQGVDLALVIATDKGLCGSLNAHLLKSLADWQEQYPNSQVVAVGKKAVNFVRQLNMEIHAQFTDLPEKLLINDLVPIIDLLMNGFQKHQFASVHLIYMDFINTLSQQPKTTQLLPIVDFSTPDVVEQKVAAKSLTKTYLFEPSAKQILRQLLPFYVKNTVYHAFLEAKASEHSARMVAMKNASENAQDLMAELRLVYNKSRQASITNELLDITTAQLGLE